MKWYFIMLLAAIGFLFIVFVKQLAWDENFLLFTTMFGVAVVGGLLYAIKKEHRERVE